MSKSRSRQIKHFPAPAMPVAAFVVAALLNQARDVSFMWTYLEEVQVDGWYDDDRILTDPATRMLAL